MAEVGLPEDDDALLALAALAELPPAEEGLFRDGSWLRRISAEPALLFGGARALLLEVAHPLVAAGVAEHSSFREDPFGRLQRTLDAMSAIAFRDRATALGAARSVERAHARVRGALCADVGPYAAGTPYSGRDPELVRWVWATLVDTSLVVYEQFVAPLPREAAESFYRDQASIARVLGVPAALVPETHRDFADWFDAELASDRLTVSGQARDVADAVLEKASRAPNGKVVGLITAALLPGRLREGFALPWDGDRAERFEGLVASVRRLRPTPAG